MSTVYEKMNMKKKIKEVESIEILSENIIMSEKNINQEFKTGKYRSNKKLFNWRKKLKWINESEA